MFWEQYQPVDNDAIKPQQADNYMTHKTKEESMRLRFNQETIILAAKLALQNSHARSGSFAEFGMDEAYFTALAKDIADAEQIAGELHHRIDLMQLTNRKREALAACWIWGRKLRIRLEMAYGRSSVQTRSFPANEFRKTFTNENEMMALMEVLIHLAREHQENLLVHGQTEQVNAEGERLLQALRDADMLQESKKGGKKSATRERHRLFHYLYNETNRINRIGRMMFADDPVTAVLFESRWHSVRILQKETVENQGVAALMSAAA
jgi:hypothetical protein